MRRLQEIIKMLSLHSSPEARHTHLPLVDFSTSVARFSTSQVGTSRTTIPPPATANHPRCQRMVPGPPNEQCRRQSSHVRDLRRKLPPPPFPYKLPIHSKPLYRLASKPPASGASAQPTTPPRKQTSTTKSSTPPANTSTWTAPPASAASTTLSPPPPPTA